MDSFLLLGDSITQRAYSPEGTPFGPALSNAYIRRLDIINRGLSGYNTSQVLSLLPSLLPPKPTHPGSPRIRLMTIFFGANDARLPDTPGGPQQHVPLEIFQRNLRDMVRVVREGWGEDVRIMLITPPAVDERMLELTDEEMLGTKMLRRTAKITRDYARGVEKAARDVGVPVVDFWGAMAGISSSLSDREGDVLPGSKEAEVDERLRGFVEDGLHLSEKGYGLLFEELMKVIEENWPDRMPDRLPFVWPAWDAEGG